MQIFKAEKGSALTLANLTLQNGNASNGTSAAPSEPPIAAYGGAVETAGNFTATNVTFLNNKAKFDGGALELLRILTWQPRHR